jgi:hypothetical protein
MSIARAARPTVALAQVLLLCDRLRWIRVRNSRAGFVNKV